MILPARRQCSPDSPHTRIQTICFTLISVALTASAATATTSSQVAFFEDFEMDAPSFVINNTFGLGNGLWHLATGCQSTEPDHSTPKSLRYGRTAACDYNAGLTEGVATASGISLAGLAGPIRLTFNYMLETEGDPTTYDVASVEVSANGGAFVAVAHADPGTGAVQLMDPSGGWKRATVDLSSHAGKTIAVRFRFRSPDNMFNEFPGFAVDDVKVTGMANRPLTMVSAVSRLPHGLVGAFDLPLFPEAQAWVEPRLAAPAMLMLCFSGDIKAGDQVIQGNEVAAAGGLSVRNLAVDGHRLIIETLPPATPGCYTLTVQTGSQGITNLAGDPISGTRTVKIRVLSGDATVDGATNVFDLVRLRNVLNQPVTPANFAGDIDASGILNIFDIIVIRNLLNKSAPTCP